MRHKGLPESVQDDHEFGMLLTMMRALDVRSVLEIGVRYGGNIARFQEWLPKAFVLGIDPQPVISEWLPEWGPLNLEVGCSQDPEIRRRALGRLGEPFYDAVFIDGDHTLPSATLDWEWARTIARKFVAIHDIHAQGISLCEVHALWKNITTSGHFQTNELYRQGSNMGIGIVWI